MKQLPEETHSQIKLLCKQGDDLANAQQLELAKEKYLEALKLLPKPQIDWDAATWIYVAIGDVHFRLGNYERCFRCFYNAVQCPNGLGNPFIHLRLGQMYFEQNNKKKTLDELTRAYMGGGAEIFMEDDPKYLEFAQIHIVM